MLTVDDIKLLGLEHERRSVRRPSAVSQALKAIREELESGTTEWEFKAEDQKDPYQIIVASDRDQRERAYRLAYQVYAESGFVPPNTNGRIVSAYDARPETLTLLAEGTNGLAVGTISLAFDSPDGLPCDELYRDELTSLRSQGRRLVEVTRLAIAKEHTHSKALLVHLFNFISVFARRVRDDTDFLVEVNPRHAAFYLRLLLFRQLGPECPCPRVGGAPAVLLRLDLAEQAEEIRKVGGSLGKARGVNGKSLYAHFEALAHEHLIAAFLAAQHRPMSVEMASILGQAPAKTAAMNATTTVAES